MQSGKNSGVVVTSMEDLANRKQNGFRMLGLGSDSGFLLNGIKQMLDSAGNL